MVGEYRVSIDKKGRFLFPAGLKKQLPLEDSGCFVINRGFEKCLNIYPIGYWRKLIEKLDKELNLFRGEHRTFYRMFVNGAQVVELDNAGRLLVPAPLLNYSGIKKEGILLAYSDRIEMWNPLTYEEMIKKFNEEDFANLAEKILGQKSS